MEFVVLWPDGVWLDYVWLRLIRYIHIPGSRCELRGVVAGGAAEILDLIVLLPELNVLRQVGRGELLVFPELLPLTQPRYGSLAAPAIPILISAGVCADQVGEIRDRWIIGPALFPTSIACITSHHIADTGGRGVQERGRGPMVLRVEVYGDRGNRP